jgi:transcriptional antiterminator RfaH
MVMAQRWYVVQTKPLQEGIALRELSNQAFTCHLPKIASIKPRRGKHTIIVSPLFPSYLFVRFNIEREAWRSINGTKGVVRLLGSTEETASPLPRGFVEEMLSRADPDGVIALQKAVRTIKKFAVGDTLKVKEGSFQGFSGTCQKTDHKTATLLLYLLSGKVAVKFQKAVLELV